MNYQQALDSCGRILSEICKLYVYIFAHRARAVASVLAVCLTVGNHPAGNARMLRSYFIITDRHVATRCQ